MKSTSTTSTVLNVFASIISILLLLASLGALFEFKLLQAFLMVIAAVILSPLSKLIFKKQKPLTVRLIRIFTPIALVIISAVTTQAISSSSNEESAISDKDIEKEKMSNLKDSLNQVLQKKDLSVCGVIDEVSKIESIAIKAADKKYPNFGKEHSDYTYKLIDSRTVEYAELKSIDSITLDKIMIFTMECTEHERQARIDNLKIQKAQRRFEKEKIDKCYEAACSIVPDKIKATLHNPKSFEMVKCEYLGIKGSDFRIRITYRGENSFGAIRTEEAIATINIETCKLQKIE